MDSQSAIQTVKNWQDGEAKGIERIIQTSDKIWRLYGKEITIQWIPGHSDIQMNDRADRLAKTGSHMQQDNIPTSYETAKQMGQQNSLEVWYNSWTTDEKGRTV